MVRQVSEDKENETLEFNEFLTMLGLQNIENIKFASLFEAFRQAISTESLIFILKSFLWCIYFSVFDKDNDGYLSIKELTKVMTTMGQKMKKKDVEEMVVAADIYKESRYAKYFPKYL